MEVDEARRYLYNLHNNGLIFSKVWKDKSSEIIYIFNKENSK
jgi:transcription initiation factor IIE alpha subunit